MIKSSKEMIFACETHRNCYETLLEIIQEGTKPNLGKIERLTVGVSVGLFDKYWRTAPWKIEFVSLVEKEQLKWEKEGGSVGKKLKLTLQTMIESGKQITPKDICTKTGVHTWYLSSTTLKNHWQRELYSQVKKEQLKWERNGGQDFKVGIEVLKNIIKSGERPNIKAVALKMGKRASYFNRKTYNWQKKLVKIIQKAEDKWKKNGGKWRKLFNETIDKYAKEGLRPQISVICDEIGYTTSNISDGTFLWQLIVQNKIINAEKNWIKHGN